MQGMIALAGMSLLLLCPESSAVRTRKTQLVMPKVKVENPDTYLCTALHLNSMTPHNILGFEPNVTSGKAHHILLYGCAEPGAYEGVWECNEMAGTGGSVGQSGYTIGPVCAPGDTQSILYAWANHAAPLKLPEGVGFSVGGADNPIQYLVAQVHYNDHVGHGHHGMHMPMDMHMQHEGHSEGSFVDEDQSGLTLTSTTDDVPKQAGVWLFGGNGRLPPARAETVDMACAIEEYTELHPFAFRVHTHGLGKVVSGYRVRGDEWTLIGKQDPQQPQMFYPLDSSVDATLQTGDIVAARCLFYNDRDEVVHIGATMKDEMCNFYLMYWTEGPNRPLANNMCFSWGPPLSYWENSGLRGIPEDESLTPV